MELAEGDFLKMDFILSKTDIMPKKRKMTKSKNYYGQSGIWRRISRKIAQICIACVVSVAFDSTGSPVSRRNHEIPTMTINRKILCTVM